MQPRKVEHPYWNGSELVALVKEVPTWTCLLCGHYVLEPGVEVTMRRLVKDYVSMGKLFPIPSTIYRES